MPNTEDPQSIAGRNIGSPLLQKLGMAVPTGFVVPQRIPSTMGQMPFVGGSGTGVVNESTHSRSLNIGFDAEPGDEGNDSYAVDAVQNGVARRAKGKTKKGIFGR